jgi:hypothetical protein
MSEQRLSAQQRFSSPVISDQNSALSGPNSAAGPRLPHYLALAENQAVDQRNPRSQSARRLLYATLGQIEHESTNPPASVISPPGHTNRQV